VIGFPNGSLETGMRRNCWVRIVVDDEGAHCELLGVGHRFPNVRRISLDTAVALAAKGVPTVVRTSGDASPRLSPTG
jgi:hypothetical protein